MEDHLAIQWQFFGLFIKKKYDDIRIYISPKLPSPQPLPPERSVLASDEKQTKVFRETLEVSRIGKPISIRIIRFTNL